jgi:hypothetical protein
VVVVDPKGSPTLAVTVRAHGGIVWTLDGWLPADLLDPRPWQVPDLLLEAEDYSPEARLPGCGPAAGALGGQLTRADLEACIADYALDDWRPTGCWMGVDVGSKLHVRINAVGPDHTTRAAAIGSVHHFSDLDGLMRQFDVSACVVDAMPEGHEARAFANRFKGRVWLCTFPNVAH